MLEFLILVVQEIWDLPEEGSIFLLLGCVLALFARGRFTCLSAVR